MSVIENFLKSSNLEYENIRNYYCQFIFHRIYYFLLNKIVNNFSYIFLIFQVFISSIIPIGLVVFIVKYIYIY